MLITLGDKENTRINPDIIISVIDIGTSIEIICNDSTITVNYSSPENLAGDFEWITEYLMKKISDRFRDISYFLDVTHDHFKDLTMYQIRILMKLYDGGSSVGRLLFFDVDSSFKYISDLHNKGFIAYINPERHSPEYYIELNDKYKSVIKQALIRFKWEK